MIKLLSDIEYIAAFRVDDQAVISAYYGRQRESFIKDIGKRFHITNKEMLTDIFQESFVRFWRNLKEEKLTEATLTGALAGYLYKIGEYVAQETFRREGKSIAVDVENERIPHIDPVGMEIVRGVDDEQKVMIRRTVTNMGEPCATLLLEFYWDRRSWESIAFDHNYADANSAKTQKYKCIQKLKALLLKP